MNDYKCAGCDEPCTAIYVDMGFSYAGTHCTNGEAGFHSDKRLVSDCCSDELEEIELVED